MESIIIYMIMAIVLILFGSIAWMYVEIRKQMEKLKARYCCVVQMIEHHDNEIICTTELNNRMFQKYIEQLNELNIKIGAQHQELETMMNQLAENKLTIAKYADQVTELDTKIDLQNGCDNCSNLDKVYELETMTKQLADNTLETDKKFDKLDVKLNLIISGNGPFYGCTNCSKFKEWINKIIRTIESEIKDNEFIYQRTLHSQGNHLEQMRLMNENDRLIKQKKVYEEFFDEWLEPKRMSNFELV